MSILVEIAEKADVSVEGVVRVLTREPVSEAIKERVLAVLDDLTPEQTRAVQRFALAALHDALPRPGEANDLVGQPFAPADGPSALPAAAAPPAADRLPTSGSDAALVQLGSVLGELAEAVRDLRRETDVERRERVDDLAVLIDLITTGWQGLDARLGRIERQVSRLESGRREPLVIAPARVAPPTIEAAPAVAVPVEPVSPPAAPASAPTGTRSRLPLVAVVTLVVAGVATLAVLQLASGGPDLTQVVSTRGAAANASATTGQSSTTAAPTSTRAETRPAATTARPPATTARPPVTTSGDPATTSAATTRPKPPAAPADPQTVSAPPAATTRPAVSTARPASFQPTRNWAWAPVDGADYYDVVFTRAGAIFYRGSPAAARLTLPSSVVFRPGPYRWVVRPGFGERTAKNLGPPVVDSPFTVS